MNTIMVHLPGYLTSSFTRWTAIIGILLTLLILPASILALGHPGLAQASTQGSPVQMFAPVVEEETAALAFGWCDGDNPATYNPAYIKTAKSTHLFGRAIELRYHTSARCVWGRISHGSPGDEIWVDRSFDGGRTWQPKLGYAKINSGYTQKYTVMYDDKNVTMRACGRTGNRREIACTGWY